MHKVKQKEGETGLAPMKDRVRDRSRNSMRYLVLLATLLLFLTSGFSWPAGREPEPKEIDSILDGAVSFFEALRLRDYERVWTGLTDGSKKAIAKDVLTYLESSTLEAVSNDFAEGGPLATSYWNAFLQTFDPDIILEQSRWEMGPVDGNKAEIDLHFKKTERPARLRMFWEHGAWRVGLAETFWSRKQRR